MLVDSAGRVEEQVQSKAHSNRPVLENQGQEVVESDRRHRLCKPGDFVHLNIIFSSSFSLR